MGSTYRVTVSARKGGCGKTTLVGFLARELVRQGARVLLVDLDPQGGTASRRLGVQTRGPLAYTSVDLVLGPEGRPFAPVELLGGRLAIIPCNLFEGAPLERHLILFQDGRAAANGLGPGARRVLLDARLRAVEGAYDVVLIDTPPDFGERVTNALEAAHFVISPVDLRSVECEDYILDMEATMKEVHRKPLFRYLPSMTTTRVQGRAAYKIAQRLCGDRLLEHLAFPLCEKVVQATGSTEEMKAYKDAAATVKEHAVQLAEMVLQLARGEGPAAKPAGQVVPLVAPPPGVSEAGTETAVDVAKGQP